VDLSVILPSYLEGENLSLLVPRLKETLDATGLKYEIIVVDTTTPMDNTPEVCVREGVNRVSRYPTNSFGDAVRTGILCSKGESVVFMDADGSHAPEFLTKLIRHRKEYDVVIASRYVEGGYTENSLLLVWMSQVLNLTYSLLLGLRYKDISNSFKLYRGDLIRGISLKTDKFDIVEEILYKMSRRDRGLRVLEVPFTFRKRMFGSTKRNLVSFMFSYLVTIVRLKFMGDD
jgi:dolichol-phosphate mannosyltransferase